VKTEKNLDPLIDLAFLGLRTNFQGTINSEKEEFGQTVRRVIAYADIFINTPLMVFITVYSFIRIWKFLNLCLYLSILILLFTDCSDYFFGSVASRPCK